MSDRMQARLESDIRILQRRVTQLKEDLHKERQDAIARVPEVGYRLLTSYSRVADEEGLRTWRYELVDRALELATPKRGEEMNDAWYNGERAYCPFCGGSAAAIMRNENTGFAYPKGLTMHLLGDGGAFECEMVAIARRLAEERVADLGR